MTAAPTVAGGSLPDPPCSLSRDTLAAWHHWCETVQSNDARSGRMAAEAAFLEAFEAEPPAARDAFVAWWCGLYLAETGHPPAWRGLLPLSPALVARALAPALSAARATGRPHAARRMAGLHSLLEKFGGDALPDPFPGPAELLDEAIALDPSDRAAVRTRMSGIVSAIDYSLHELPYVITPHDNLRADTSRALELAPALGCVPQAGALDRALDTLLTLVEAAAVRADPEQRILAAGDNVDAALLALREVIDART